MFGRQFHLPIDSILNVKQPQTLPEYVRETQNNLNMAYEIATRNDLNAREAQSHYANRNAGNRSFKVGDKVYYLKDKGDPNLKRKLIRKWIGPCIITKVCPQMFML